MEALEMGVKFRKPLQMIVNLPNGKAVDLSFEDYLRIGMEDYQYLMSHNLGEDIEYPFFASILHYKGHDDSEDEASPEDEDDEYLPFEAFEE
jgi:hypothetical protein